MTFFFCAHRNGVGVVNSTERRRHEGLKIHIMGENGRNTPMRVRRGGEVERIRIEKKMETLIN